MHALNGAGILAAEQGDFAAARAHFEAALELARALGVARPDRGHGDQPREPRACTRATTRPRSRRYEEATAIARELGDERALSLALQNLGHRPRGRRASRARDRRARGERRARRARVADPGHLASTQRTLARVLLDDDRARALALLHESLELAQRPRRPQRDRRVPGDRRRAPAARPRVLLGRRRGAARRVAARSASPTSRPGSPASRPRFATRSARERRRAHARRGRRPSSKRT